MSASTDSADEIVLGSGTFPVANQMIVPFVSPNAYKSLTIVGQGPGLTTISANQQGRDFEIKGDVTLRALTVTGGVVQSQSPYVAATGGGILIDSGNVMLDDVVVSGNQALGAQGAPGAAPTGPTDPGQGGEAGGDAFGGGIFLASGDLTMQGCTIQGNGAVGGTGGDGVGSGDYNTGGLGGDGGNAWGGGLYVSSGTVIGRETVFTNNTAVGGDAGAGGIGNGGIGGQGGNAFGGAFYLVSSSSESAITLFGGAVNQSRAKGGNGGAGGSDPLSPYGITTDPANPGSGGAGGTAEGGGGGLMVQIETGAIEQPASATLVSTTFNGDTAVGGDGGAGGQGVGDDPGSGNGAWGGDGGWGGAAYGGALYADPAAGTPKISFYGGSIVNCSAGGGNGKGGGNGVNASAWNGPYPADSALINYGGFAGSGGDGGAAGGGGIYAGGSLFLCQTSVINDSAVGGSDRSPPSSGGDGASSDPGGSPDPHATQGGDGGPAGGGSGGNAMGGGCSIVGGNLQIAGCTFDSDSVVGGAGQDSGNGGNAASGVNSYQSGSAFTSSLDGGGTYGGDGGAGYGGDLYLTSTQSVYVSNSFFAGTASGGPGGTAGKGGNGGDGADGVDPSEFGCPGGDGGSSSGGNGGDAQGAGVYVATNVPQATFYASTAISAGTLSPGAPGAAGTPGTGGAPGSNYSPSFPGDTGEGSPGEHLPGSHGATGGADIEYAAGQAPAAPIPGAIAEFDFSPIPPSVFSGAAFAEPVYVYAVDASFHVAGTFSASVSLTTIASEIDTNPDGTELGGTPVQNAVGGVAVFSNLSVTDPVTNAALLASTPGVTDIPNATPYTFNVIGYTPDQVRKAYGITQLGFDSSGHALDGTGETIAIITPWHDPSLFQDVDGFDKQFGLDTTYGAASSFLTVVNQNGGTIPAPLPPKGVDVSENSLDVEWAHALAPGAKIVVIEFDNTLGLSQFGQIPGLMGAVAFADLLAGGSRTLEINGIALPPVSVVSMSLGKEENQLLSTSYLEPIYDQSFQTPGVTYVASSGDGTGAGDYPAYSPYVVAVGGTDLYLRSDSTRLAEVAWEKSEGGASVYEPAPSYQNPVPGDKRTIPDVAFVAAAPASSGVAIFDSYDLPATNPWMQVNGTSIGAPCWAALFAIVNQGRQSLGRALLSGAAGPQTLPAIYDLGRNQPQDFNKITQIAIGGARNNTGFGTPVANNLVPDLINYGAIKFSPASLPGATANQSYTAQIQVSSINGSVTLGYKVLSQPPGTQGQFTFSPTNGKSASLTIQGTPSAAAFPAGNNVITFEVTATDSSGLSQTADYTIQVNPPLHFDTISLPEGTQGQAFYRQAITVSGGTGQKVIDVETPTFSPFGLRIYAMSGDPGQLLVEGTPSSYGSIDLKVMAKDAAGASTPWMSVTLVINRPIALGKLSRTSWTKNKRGFEALIPVTGGTRPYELAIEGLPPNLQYAIDQPSGMIKIVGTPTQAVNRRNNVVVTITDTAGVTATRSYTLKIKGGRGRGGSHARFHLQG